MHTWFTFLKVLQKYYEGAKSKVQIFSKSKVIKKKLLQAIKSKTLEKLNTSEVGFIKKKYNTIKLE